MFIKCKVNELQTKQNILVTPISDHLPTFLTVLGPKNKEKTPRYVTYRKYSTIAMNNFKTAIQNARLTDYINTDDVNINYGKVLDQILRIYDENFPLVKRRFNRKKDFVQKWMTTGILNSINNRDDQYVDYIKTKRF